MFGLNEFVWLGSFYCACVNQESCVRQAREAFFPVQIQEMQRKYVRPSGPHWDRPFPLKMSLRLL